MAWQHPQPWQSTITPCKMTCLIFHPEHVALQCCQWSALCNSQTSLGAFGKSFLLSTLTSRDLMPSRLCRSLLLLAVKLLPQAASPTYSFSLSFNNPLQRDSRTSSFLSLWQTRQHLQMAKHFLFLILMITWPELSSDNPSILCILTGVFRLPCLSDGLCWGPSFSYINRLRSATKLREKCTVSTGGSVFHKWREADLWAYEWWCFPAFFWIAKGTFFFSLTKEMDNFHFSGVEIMRQIPITK